MSSLLDRLNHLDRQQFVRIVGPVFERSPWIADAAFSQIPFANLATLHGALCDTVRQATADQQLALIRAHPDLVGRAALAGTLTPSSTGEQAAAGLNQLSPDEVALFQKYNAEYREKFGFPFVICARLNRKEAILAGFTRRLQNTRSEEIATALAEIFKITELRLQDLSMPSKLTTHVLDTANGCPARDLKIELWLFQHDQRRLLATVKTNADGRTDAPLLSAEQMSPGQYELLFFVGDYFATKTPSPPAARFLDQVPVRFGIADPSASYHVPLLVSPWAYSTYRGS